jgi:rhodanese-related sulfurtransferase
VIIANGRKEAVALRGGLDAWEAKGYPMERTST